MRRLLIGGFGVAVVTLLMAFASMPSKAAEPSVSVDIELAFDTTESMATVLATARHDAQQVIDGVRAVVPDARFGVVSFRDPGNPGGEYQTLQPLTSDTTALERALGRLEARSNPSPNNSLTESYNLAFHRSYADNALGWRPASRKIVVVIGDAQGYGAGTAGLPGCTDTQVDPDGFDVRTELAGMLAARRTLVMIRELSPQVSVSLDCYRALAALSYPGGAARDGNTADLATPLVALVRGAVAPITITPAFPLTLPGSKLSFVVKVFNPNEFAVQANTLTVTIPGSLGFASVAAAPQAVISSGTLSWTVGKMLGPRSGLRYRVTMKAPATQRRAIVRATGNFQLADGAEFTSDSSVTLHVTRQLLVLAKASTPGRGISGAAGVVIPTHTSLAKAVGPVKSGVFTIKSGRRSLSMRPYRFSLSLRLGNAAATFQVLVIRSRGVSGCGAGTRGTLKIVDQAFGAASGAATASTVFPRVCVGLTTRVKQAASIQPTP